MPKPKPSSTGNIVVAIDAVVVTQRPLPDQHEYYTLIGRVAAEWAQLEHSLDLIIWDLAKTENKANSCITGQIIGYSPRFKAISALAKYRGHDNDTLKRIDRLKGQVAEMADQRARYIHDAWFVQAIGNNVDDVYAVGQFKSLSTKSKKFGFTPIPKEEIKNFIQKIKSQTQKISALRADLSQMPKP